MSWPISYTVPSMAKLNRDGGRMKRGQSSDGAVFFFFPAPTGAEHPPESRVKGWAVRPRGGDFRVAKILPPCPLKWLGGGYTVAYRGGAIPAPAPAQRRVTKRGQGGNAPLRGPGAAPLDAPVGAEAPARRNGGGGQPRTLPRTATQSPCCPSWPVERRR